MVDYVVAAIPGFESFFSLTFQHGYHEDILGIRDKLTDGYPVPLLQSLGTVSPDKSKLIYSESNDSLKSGHIRTFFDRLPNMGRKSSRSIDLDSTLPIDGTQHA